MTEKSSKAGSIKTCLIIVKQTFKALAESSGDERLLQALGEGNPNAEKWSLRLGGMAFFSLDLEAQESQELKEGVKM